MKILQSQPNANLSSHQTKEDAPLTEKIADIAERLDTVPAAILFTVIFYSVLSITGALGFSFSAIVFRKLLRSLSKTDDLFLVVSACGLTFGLLTLLTTVCMLVIGVVGTPALWMFTPIAVIISAISWKFAFVVSVSAATLTWLFSGPALLVVALIIFSPLIVATAITICTLIALTKPLLFHKVVVRVLLLCKQKNPIVTLASLVALLALILVFLLKSGLWIFTAIAHVLFSR